MNVQYRSFRNAWIAFNIPSIAAGMLIFTVVLLDLLIRIVQSKDMLDGQSLVFLMLRMIVASSVSMMWELSNL
jgi:hypothetical protein